MKVINKLFVLVILYTCVQGAFALDDGDGSANNCDHYNPLNNPYFGDTHTHTTYSADAFTAGTDTTPEQAYQFASGDRLGLHPFDENSEPTRFAQLDRPLDFAMVSDHAEYFGEYTICHDETHPEYANSQCTLLRRRTFFSAMVWIGKQVAPQDEVSRFAFCGPDGSICTNEAPILWQRIQQAADQYYDRSSDCTLTTLIGYEWSASPTRTSPDGYFEELTLHRNVVFRNSIVPDAPTSYFDAPYPEQLYDALDADCINAGDPAGDCDVLLIPHNSNLSQGVTFATSNPDGTPYDEQDAIQRGRLERLIEVFQNKGNSECLPGGSDELCGFEFIPGEYLVGAPAVEEGTVRDALKNGLQKGNTLGTNPFKFGMVGSTDTHIGTPGLVRESEDYPGHGVTIGSGNGLKDAPMYNPGGLAVVWATQNSRAAVFDAMRRREVYATSGPRHVVRFFGGYDLPSDICSESDLVQVAYDNGVPMGGELPQENPGSASPKFLVWAIKDPGVPEFPGNDLQRIQIIKGWTDAAGMTHEKVYDVAGEPDNGAGVDINTCTNTGSGFTELCQHWADPDFDPAESAFYYARVLENPSCRWTQRQCIAMSPPADCEDPESLLPENFACCDEKFQKTVQERSWTSPIWYEGERVQNPPPGC